MNSISAIDDTLLVLLVAEDRGSPCAELALLEFARIDPDAGRVLAEIEYVLALRFLNGDGVPCDPGLARRHFENAAVFGHPFPEASWWEEN